MTLSGILTVMFFGHSDYCGVSIQIIKKVYSHHIPGGFDGVLAGPERNIYATETGEMNGNEARQRRTKVK